ncbi:MAG: type II toxin-antitoxin system RelE/ParE family toxin [Bacteroidales bacterium]|jgi:toxin ParE1/3/4|nr:type II toxin-antitoxin system RelE/ParE family toxin [Bacteroidales bacterium]
MEIDSVIISHFAEVDLIDIIEYYKSLSYTYVQKTIEDFECNIKGLKQYPCKGRIVPELQKQGIEKYRELIQGNYRIVYEISGNTIIIHTILDSRRDFESIIVAKLIKHYM